MRHRSANKILQGGLIDVVTFVEVNGARRLCLKAGVEEAMRIHVSSTAMALKNASIHAMHPTGA